MVKFLVHSPPKTASSSMDHFLMQFGTVMRAHFLQWEDAIVYYGQASDVEAEYGVTIIREPVARNISDYWEQYRQERYSPRGKLSVLLHFLCSVKHDVAINFPKMELEPRWGVDIFSKEYTPPFTQHGNLLVTRVEDLDDFAAEINGRFPREGTGSYDKDAIKVPDAYVDMLHQTKYYKHFYGD